MSVGIFRNELSIATEPAPDPVTESQSLRSAFMRGLDMMKSAIESGSLRGIPTGVKPGSVRVTVVQENVQ